MSAALLAGSPCNSAVQDAHQTIMVSCSAKLKGRLFLIRIALVDPYLTCRRGRRIQTAPLIKGASSTPLGTPDYDGSGWRVLAVSND